MKTKIIQAWMAEETRISSKRRKRSKDIITSVQSSEMLQQQLHEADQTLEAYSQELNACNAKLENFQRGWCRSLQHNTLQC